MKFAKELERDAVPEWRAKYLNYKVGKKHVKAVARATSKANAITPKLLPNRAASLFGQPPSSGNQQTFRTTFNPREHRDSIAAVGPPTYSSRATHAPRSSFSRSGLPKDSVAEDDALNVSRDTNLQYGSFVPTLHHASPPDSRGGTAEFELPSPAIHSRPDPSSPDATVLSKDGPHKHLKPSAAERRNTNSFLPAASSENTCSPTTLAKRKSRPSNERRSSFRRMFSHSPSLARHASITSLGLEPFDLIREREHKFYQFMDSELEKVESFYKLKEEQAGRRLELLREQLHEMRNRRLQEIIPNPTNASALERMPLNGNDSDSGTDRGGTHIRWVQPIKSKLFPPGPNSKALHDMPQTPHIGGSNQAGGHRDYTRGPEHQDVSYRTAKRKLKLALQEFYRGLELLKSYALLNRTAFRKLNKKFDKACNARPPLRFINEKVNKAWFVKSDLLEGHIKVVEDLYARYFERGNHKVAAGKLRSLAKKSSDESGSSFLNGFLIGTGIVFSIQGLIYGARLLLDDDLTLSLHTSYLLQIYAGYFLMLLLFSYFCLNCYVWTRYKVNYSFIFELDPRSRLDWRRLSEFPSFFLLLFGVVMWANFSRYGDSSLYLYYPIILIAITVAIIFFPFPFLAQKSRRWFAYSHWRLLLAGIYPVEFRDFFLGDIYCSLTYCMASLELFFCLYANEWQNPAQCNSSNSRSLGFLTTVPALWRFFQCLRRYRDTRNVFPHLVNAGKYTMTIISYVMLSLYRIDRNNTNLALFIFFSIINSVYCSIWDLFMDFSLLQFDSHNTWLRDILALKKRWPYYFIMIVDPILRFNWILYVVIPMDANHSTIFSFAVALLEVTRRGMWTLFRVENEHCANVGQYKASRDVPLPYRIEPLIGNTSAEVSPLMQSQDRQKQQQQQQKVEGDAPGRPSSSAPGHIGVAGSPSTAPNMQQQAVDSTSPATAGATAGAHAESEIEDSPTAGAGRRRRATGGLSTTAAGAASSSASQGTTPRLHHKSARTFSKMLADAHTQDFEKKRKKVDADAGRRHGGGEDDDDDDDDDDDVVDTEYEDEDVADVRAVQEAARLRRRADSAVTVEEGNAR